MKRVLLLVCLIISLAELDLERARVYLLSSAVSLFLVVWSELVRRRQAQRAQPAEAFRAPHRQDHAAHVERVEPNPVAM